MGGADGLNAWVGMCNHGYAGNPWLAVDEKSADNYIGKVLSGKCRWIKLEDAEGHLLGAAVLQKAGDTSGWVQPGSASLDTVPAASIPWLAKLKKPAECVLVCASRVASRRVQHSGRVLVALTFALARNLPLFGASRKGMPKAWFIEPTSAGASSPAFCNFYKELAVMMGLRTVVAAGRPLTWANVGLMRLLQ